MTVDVIIPTYNRASFLSETLKSVQAQTYEDWLCWIAEDGDSPETRDAVRPFWADRRFRSCYKITCTIPAVPLRLLTPPALLPFWPYEMTRLFCNNGLFKKYR